MNDEFGRDLKGNCHDLIEAIPPILAFGTQESNEKLQSG
jgi:hypothetical protein